MTAGFRTDAHTHSPVFSLVFWQVHTTTDDADGLDDVENSLLYYNQAIIHYYLRQFSEAISIGERLYQFLEPFGTLGCSVGLERSRSVFGTINT